MRVVNLEACFHRFSDTFSPKIVAELNGQHVRLVRLEGDKAVRVRAGEFTVVPRGLENRVVPEGHVRLILFEPAGIEHTGKVRSEITRDHYDVLE